MMNRSCSPFRYIAVVAALMACLPVALLAEESEGAPAVEIPNALTPLPEVLVGGQPTPEVLAEAAAAGYKTIVSVRGDSEIDWDEAAAVEKLGMRFVSLPIAAAGDLSAAKASELAELLDDPELRPMMVHCGSGNRVGGLFALKAFHIDGLAVEESVEVGRAAGLTGLEAGIRSVLSAAAQASD